MNKLYLILALIAVNVYADNVDKGLELLKDDNFDAGLTILKQEASNGNVKAQRTLGDAYSHYYQIENSNKAIKWYTKAGNNGDIQAQMELGDIYYLDMSNNDKAIHWYRKAAQQGSAEAQTELASLLDNKKEAAKWYRKAAEQGYLDAQMDLVYLYRRDEGDITAEEALKWAKLAAVAEHSVAPELVAEINTKLGRYQEAIKWYKIAIDFGGYGTEENQYHLGEVYVTLGEYKKAVNWYITAAANDSIEAQFQLGLLLAQGKGIEKNSQKAIWLMTGAADKARGEIKYQLAQLYSQGTIVDKNYSLAIKWFYEAYGYPLYKEKAKNSIHAILKRQYPLVDDEAQKAFRSIVRLASSEDDIYSLDYLREYAHNGNADAQVALGKAYEYGNAKLSENKTKAEKWYRKAANARNSEAEYRLYSLKTSATNSNTVSDEAITWLFKAFLNDHDFAREALFHAAEADKKEVIARINEAAVIGQVRFQYISAILQLKDTKTAPNDGLKLLKSSANQGYAPAQSVLGRLYLAGNMVEKSTNSAIEWIEKAAKQDHIESMMVLGMIYLQSPDIKKDAVTGLKWFTKAANLGVHVAQFNVGMMYIKGEGVEKDIQQARLWLTFAKLHGNPNAQRVLDELRKLGE